MTEHFFTKARTDGIIDFRPERPVMTVVVDTEEEFDWGAPFSRENTATTSATAQSLAHEVFDPLGVKPVYVMDQAIVDSDEASDFFSCLKNDDRCEIGVHLHPWLTPPFDEEVCALNSFQGNLSYELERQKIINLSDSIQLRFGEKPTVFKAGRYGVGANSYHILADLGFKVDCSVVPYTTYREIGGPDFYGLPASLFWINDEESLLGLPLSRGFTGMVSGVGPFLKGLFDRSIYRHLRIPGVLSRINMVRRVTLTPEGVSSDDQKKLLKQRYDQGERFFSLAYHSSSLGVGHTPYVRSKGDLKALLDNLRDVLIFFQQELGGQFMSVTDVYNQVLSSADKTGMVK